MQSPTVIDYIKGIPIDGTWSLEFFPFLEWPTWELILAASCEFVTSSPLSYKLLYIFSLEYLKLALRMCGHQPSQSYQHQHINE